jgi:hypothetical protein
MELAQVFHPEDRAVSVDNEKLLHAAKQRGPVA